MGLAGSLALSVYGVAFHPNSAFYLLPARAWELLLGAVVSFAGTDNRLLRARPARQTVELLGLVSIGLAAVLYTPATPFPGLAALVPTTGTAMLVWAVAQKNRHPATAIEALLASSPVVRLGLMSYSIYLWHWPLVAYTRYLSIPPPPLGLRVLLLGAGVACGALSWRLVEQPFRARILCRSRRSMLGFAGVSLAAVLALGAGCVAMQGVPRRFPPELQAVADAQTDRAFINELTVDRVRAGGLIPLGASGSGAHPVVLVWGDSHAMAALPAIDALLSERGVAGRAATHSATVPVLDWHVATAWGLGQDSIAFNDAVFEYARREQIQDVILAPAGPATQAATMRPRTDLRRPSPEPCGA